MLSVRQRDQFVPNCSCGFAPLSRGSPISAPFLGSKSSPFSAKAVALVATVEVRFWPLADIPNALGNVRFWGKRGHPHRRIYETELWNISPKVRHSALIFVSRIIRPYSSYCVRLSPAKSSKQVATG